MGCCKVNDQPANANAAAFLHTNFIAPDASLYTMRYAIPPNMVHPYLHTAGHAAAWCGLFGVGDLWTRRGTATAQYSTAQHSTAQHASRAVRHTTRRGDRSFNVPLVVLESDGFSLLIHLVFLGTSTAAIGHLCGGIRVRSWANRCASRGVQSDGRGVGESRPPAVPRP